MMAMPTTDSHAAPQHQVEPQSVDDTLTRRTEEVLGDLQRCMSHLDVRVSPARLLEAASRIANHELGRREPKGWWPR